jgi:non-heme chloroperoxidase
MALEAVMRQIAALAVVLFMQVPAAWRDPGSHRVQFVIVDKGVKLEVLDWGGGGRPVVLLAGSGLTAHVYDDFAPKLTGCCHVYGITRRGYGASSLSASGYDNQRLADDILQVIDALHLDSPVLIGHSMAGGEITTVGNQHSDRLGGLVYLDALGDPRDWPASNPEWMALLRSLPAGMQAPARDCGQEPRTFSAYRTWQMCREKFAFPESELRMIFETNPDGTMAGSKTPGWVHDAIGDGEIKRDYSHIKVPVLAFLELPRPADLALLRPDEYHPKNDEEARAMLALARATKPYMDRWIDNLKRSVPNARLVDLPGAGHFLFMTREADVLREMRSFVASLPRR